MYSNRAGRHTTWPFSIWSGRTKPAFFTLMQDPYPTDFLQVSDELSQGGLISSTHASELFSITNDYITRLCRKKNVTGVLVGRLWFVDAGSLRAYLGNSRQRREEHNRALSVRMRSEYEMRTGLANTQTL